MIAAKCMVSLMTERNIETISGCYKTMALLSFLFVCLFVLFLQYKKLILYFIV